MSASAAALDLRVRLLPEPCLWCWEIVDRHRGGALIRSSWTGEWTGYETPGEALAAGHARLAALRSVAGGRTSGEGCRKGESAA